MDRLTADGALAALAQIDAVTAAFAETAPRAVARMGGAEGLIARSAMTAIGPIPSFTMEEWSRMVQEHAKLSKGVIV